MPTPDTPPSSAAPPSQAASGLNLNAPPIVWTIAGHDPSSGAGITADLATFAAFHLFGGSVLTALTAQSTLGIAAVEPVSPEFLATTLHHLAADLPPVGIKIGVVGTAANARVLGQFLEQRGGPGAPGSRITIVLDPVLRSSSGASLLQPHDLHALLGHLLPRAGWITPNRQELATLSGLATGREDEVRSAADALGRLHPHLAIIATGGDEPQPVDILRLPDGSFHRFAGHRLTSRATHGTGCVFSSALLAALVLGLDPIQAVATAKSFVEQGIRTAPTIGNGQGPLNLRQHVQLSQQAEDV